MHPRGEDFVPVLPWSTCQYRAETQLHVLTSRLPLKSYRDIPRFLRWTFKIRKQLRDDPGCAGYSLDARLFTKTFWTLSAWADHDAMTRFVHSDQHAAMLADMAGRVGNPSFVDSTARQRDLPLDWTAARARIADTT
jgi:quinol monooxygenase YgiN